MASSKKKKKKVEAPVKYEGSVVGNALKNTISGENTKRGNIWGLITGSPLGSMFGNIIDESEKKKELSKSSSQIEQEKKSNKTIEQAKTKSDESYNKLNEYKKQKGINLFNESKFKNDEEYNEFITRHDKERVETVDINSYEYNGERLLLCSDGLYNNVSPLIIESTLKGNDTVTNKCQQLIAFGNSNGGSDNMAVVIWENK